MISHRLRLAVAGLPIVVMSALLATSPAFAADALRITTPLADATVSGPLTVEGMIAGERAVDLDLALARQVLGDCGSPLVSSTVSVAGDFIASIPTAGVPDGTYCLLAVADSGRLSAVIADITVQNLAGASASLDGLQLTTEALDETAGGAGPVASTAPLVTSTMLGELPVLGAAVLAIALTLAAVVLGTGLWARRRTAA